MATPDTLSKILPPSVRLPGTGLTRSGSTSKIRLLMDSVPASVFASSVALLAFGLSFASSNYLGLPQWGVPAVLAAGVLAYPIRGALIVFGFLHNPYAARVLPGHVRCVVPVPSTSTDEKNVPSSVETGAIPPTGSPEFAIVHLYTRSNSPFGVFTPEFMEIGSWFQGMMDELEADREKSGLLNAEQYLSTGRGNANRLLTIFYFRSADHVWKWTKEGVHKSVWMKLAKAYDRYPWIELAHEMFVVKESGFEGIYSNSEPHSAGALFTKDDEEGSETFGMWVPTLREMGKKDRLSKGRMTTQPANVPRESV